MTTSPTRPDLTTFERHESEVRSYVRSFPTVFDRAKGSRLYDEDDRVYVDFFSGAGALNYGHNDTRLQKALLEYVANDGITHSLDMATTAKRRFIDRFHEVILAPRGLDHKLLFPGPTGTNAVEAALKLVRKATGRETVFGFRNGFHGMTLGSLSVTSNPMKRAGAGVPLEHAELLPFDGEPGSLDVLRERLDEAARADALPAAVVLETVQCEGGVHTASAEWLRGVEQACRDHGVLLVVDDIQAGCGRTGAFFSFEDAGLRPDVVCLSKSLSGMGLPLAIVLLRPELDVFQPGEHNGTFRGHNPAFVTATRALDLWRSGELEAATREKAARLRERLEAILAGHPGLAAEIRGRGMVLGVAFEDANLASSTASACFERGLVIETAGPGDEVLKLLPALTIPAEDLERGLDVLADGLDAALHDKNAEPALT